MSSSEGWVWQEQGGWRWLQCQLLADWPHAFGCRRSSFYQPAELAEQLRLTPERAAWGYQVHGCQWMWADALTTIPAGKAESRVQRPAVDAVIARCPEDSAWVGTADCVPILVASRRWVAAVHAGWRGTAAGILPKVLQVFLGGGIPAEEIRIALGPAISGPAYQVSQAVADKVLQTLPAGVDPQLALWPDPIPGKVRLDLRWVNSAQAQAQGIPPEHIAISPHCTFGQPQDFFSYRREGSLEDEEGRRCVQWSGIGLPKAALDKPPAAQESCYD
ncbi:polyphenol oxidase family protein [Synechococcus sp. W65.1]|uniref:polyphenol oxidase family protein n=1 Tax=Synechococcus sp. W65.1 TaxID=2964526 RepID=UPI0039C3DC09